MKTLGVVAMVIGAVVMLIAFFLQTSVAQSPDLSSIAGGYANVGRMTNLAMLQVQTLVFQTGAVLLIAGAIFTGAGQIAERLGTRANIETVDAPSGSSDASPVPEPARPASRIVPQEARDADHLPYGPWLVLAAVCMIGLFVVVVAMR